MQTPLTRVLPTPHPTATCVVIASGWWSGAGDMACADDARAKAKVPTASERIIEFSPGFKLRKCMARSLSRFRHYSGSERNGEMLRLADHLTRQTDDFILQQQECQDDEAKYNRECNRFTVIWSATSPNRQHHRKSFYCTKGKRPCPLV